MSATEVVHPSDESRSGLLAWWHHTPLYLRIVGALVLGIGAGLLLGERAEALKQVSDLVLRLLAALATPLILIAVIHALASAEINGRMAKRLIFLLGTNTLMAIFIGLLVANTLQPGRLATVSRPAAETASRTFDPWQFLAGNIPESLLGPLVENNVIAVIFIALAFGIALRVVRRRQTGVGETGYRAVEDLVGTAFRCLMVVLHWVIDILPFAVFAVVARLVGTQGFQPFVSLGAFVIAVILALLLQALYYLARVRLGSWVSPRRFLRGGADALMTALSTASSTATMPITYGCLKEKIGLREEPASMGALVGANFNNDGTALYEAMAALFVSQVIGMSLGLPQQMIVVAMAVVASVGAAGIPEAGLVTMLLVFTAVGLPVEYVPLLLPVDWFLDRCRTAINVMGDMSVASLLDGRYAESRSLSLETSPEPAG
jgi:DAACS family dicarboxylate/amino acid:cation (Na+ or H+) symporter